MRENCLEVKVVPVELIREYQKGALQAEIAKKHGITVAALRKILIERGVKLLHPIYRNPF